jgi:hypothetical protein
VTKFVNCKDSEYCEDCGAAKFSSEVLVSKRKAKVKFSNNNNNYSMQFVSPKKAKLSETDVEDNPIHGMLNLAYNS